MFKAEMVDARLLKDSLEAVAELIDEGELIIGKDGIRLVASDRAVVAVVDYFISRNAFEKYEFTEDARLGVNMGNFMNILRRAKNERLAMSADGSGILISFHGDSSRHFTLPVIAVSREETPDLVKLESGFTTAFAVDSEALANGVEDAELVGDSIVFTVRKDMFILHSEGDSSSTRLEMLPSASLEIVKVSEPVRARYSIDYMKKMLKARKLSDRARVSLASEYPMKLSFSVPDKVELSFILAPRVEEG